MLSMRMGSTKAIKSPRDSTASTIESLADIEAVNDYQAALRQVDEDVVSTNHESWPMRTPAGSPTPPRADVHQVAAQGPKSPFIVSDVATKSSSLVDSPATSRPNLRAPKAFRLPFLPRLLRPSSKEREDPPAVPMKSPSRLPKSKEDPTSFFDDASSIGEEPETGTAGEGYGYEIQDARQAIVGSPVLVKHSSSTKVELKEMLRSTPPTAENNPGPSKGKAAAILGENFDAVILENGSKRQGIYTGVPQEQQGDDAGPDTGSTKTGPLGLGLWKDINPFAMSVLRSHQSLLNPISSSVPAPAPPPKSAPPVPAARKVSFPPPPPLDIRPEHRFLRQSIVSTPYPTGTSAEKEKKRKEKAAIKGIAEEKDGGDGDDYNGLRAVLTLVLYGNSNPIPKVKTIVIPNAQETPLLDETENGKPPITAMLTQDFDDKKFFNLLRFSYNNLHSPLRHLASARTVHSLKLLSYTSMSQLASRQGRSMHFRSDDVQEEIAETRMLEMFLKPRLGRGRNEWVNWARMLPENRPAKEGEAEEDRDKIAIEFVEGWAVAKLCFAVAAVLFCSLLATLLWIFVGSGGGGGGVEVWNGVQGPGLNMKDLADGYNGLAGPPLGHQGGRSSGGAGGRLEAGAVLGMFVLMFGWTGVAAWVGLSWLVM